MHRRRLQDAILDAGPPRATRQRALQEGGRRRGQLRLQRRHLARRAGVNVGRPGLLLRRARYQELTAGDGKTASIAENALLRQNFRLVRPRRDGRRQGRRLRGQQARRGALRRRRTSHFQVRRNEGQEDGPRDRTNTRPSALVAGWNVSEHSRANIGHHSLITFPFAESPTVGALRTRPLWSRAFKSPLCLRARVNGCLRSCDRRISPPPVRRASLFVRLRRTNDCLDIRTCSRWWRRKKSGSAIQSSEMCSAIDSKCAKRIYSLLKEENTKCI